MTCILTHAFSGDPHRSGKPLRGRIDRCGDSTVAREHHVRDRVKPDIVDVQVDDFLDTCTGVVKQQNQSPVTAIDARLDEGHDLVLFEIADLVVLATRGTQLADRSAALLASASCEVCGRVSDPAD